MENEIYEDFVPYLKDLLCEQLREYEDRSFYGSDLAYKILECYNVDGTITYSTYKAKKYLQQWWDDAADYFQYEKDNFGEAHNPFENPEAFMVCMCIEGANTIFNKCPTVETFWDDDTKLTSELIENIITEIKEISDYENLF